MNEALQINIGISFKESLDLRFSLNTDSLPAKPLHNPMSNTAIIPMNYAEWRVCIEKRCGLALTRTFCEARLAALRDANDAHTRDFARLYGESQLASTISWFERAYAESGAVPPR